MKTKNGHPQLKRTILAVILCCVVLAVGRQLIPPYLSRGMRSAIDTAITERGRNDETVTRIVGKDCHVIGVRRSFGKITVYAWVLYQEYSRAGDDLREECGWHCPTAITLKKADGGYTVTEYWEPRDGSYFWGDLQRKFPPRLWLRLSGQRYIERQEKKCLRDAVKTYGEPHSDQQILSLIRPNASGTVQFVLRGSPEPVCPCVSLDPEKQSFQFPWSALSSYLAMGKYTVTDDGILTLVTDGGTDTYTFVLRDGTFVFDAKKSSPIPEYRYGEGEDPECPVPDGAVFHLQPFDGR